MSQDQPRTDGDNRMLRISPSRPLRIGTLGAAQITPSALIEPAKLRDDVIVAAVAARDPERAKSFADEHGIDRVHGDYTAVIEDPELDAIYVPLPISEHAQWTIAALQAGKHVLCEKPFANNAREAAAMANAAEGTGLVLMEAFHWRYHPLAERLLEILASDEIGKPVRMDARFTAPIPDGNIRLDYSLGGGATMDLGAYPISWMRAIAGVEPEVVKAEALESPPRIDRTMTADLLFKRDVGDLSGHIYVSMRSEDGFTVKLEIEGTKGRIDIDNPMAPHLFHRFEVKPTGGESRTESWPSLADQTGDHVPTTYDHQLEAFVAALRDGQSFPTTARDAVAQMAVVDACYRAAGLPVRGT